MDGLEAVQVTCLRHQMDGIEAPQVMSDIKWMA